MTAAGWSSSAAARAGSRRPRSRAARAPTWRSSSARSCAGSPTTSRTGRAGRLQQRLYRIAYPVVGYGPPPLNRLALHPDAFAALPERGPPRGGAAASCARAAPRGCATRSRAGSRSPRARRSKGLERSGDDLRLDAQRRHGARGRRRRVSAGFRFALDRMAFLSPTRARRRSPCATAGRCSTANSARREPHLLCVGFAAERQFGPIARFVNGSRFTAYRVRRALGPRPRARAARARGPRSTGGAGAASA